VWLGQEWAVVEAGRVKDWPRPAAVMRHSGWSVHASSTQRELNLLMQSMLRWRPCSSLTMPCCRPVIAADDVQTAAFRSVCEGCCQNIMYSARASDLACQTQQSASSRAFVRSRHSASYHAASAPCWWADVGLCRVKHLVAATVLPLGSWLVDVNVGACGPLQQSARGMRPSQHHVVLMHICKHHRAG
jgi:hypothetical protein